MEAQKAGLDARKFNMLGYLVGYLAFVAPILAFYAPKGLTLHVIFGALCGLIILKNQTRPIHWLDRKIIYAFVALCIWAALSVFWSIDQKMAIIGTLKLSGNLVIGGVLFSVFRSLRESEQKVALRALLAGLVVAIIFIVLELFFDSLIISIFKPEFKKHTEAGAYYWYNILIVLLGAFIWLFGVAIFRLVRMPLNSGLVYSVTIFGTVPIFLLAWSVNYSTGVLALGLGVFASAIMWFLGRRAAIIAAILLVMVGLLSPIIVSEFGTRVVEHKNDISLPNSAEHRIRIWEFTADKISQKMIVGWGMNASRVLPGGGDQVLSVSGIGLGEILPLHPHNALLQIWLELGLPGVIIFLGLCAFILISVVRDQRQKFKGSIIVGQFVTLLTIANLSFGIWQAWWISTLWLSAAMMTMVVERKPNSHN